MNKIFHNSRLVLAFCGLGLIALFQNCAPSANPFNIGNATSSSSSPTPPPTPASYSQIILNDNPSYYWTLGDAPGASTLTEKIAGNNGTPVSVYTLGVPGAIFDDPTTAILLEGSGINGYIFTANLLGVPIASFSQEIWIQTRTTYGGGIMSFENSQGSGNPTKYDRQIWMTDGGQIYAGQFIPLAGSVYACGSSSAYNDGQWHHVVAVTTVNMTQLYVDSVEVCTLNLPSALDSFAGYWILGLVRETSWPDNSAHWNFSGALDEAAVYNSALTQAQILAHYNSGHSGN